VVGEVVVEEVLVVAGGADGAVDFEPSLNVGGVFSLGGGNFCGGLTYIHIHVFIVRFG
jgi:hypothetical protein